MLVTAKYEEWRFGRVPYLGAICTVNLKKLSFIMHQMRLYARRHELKPSESFYKQWGLPKHKGTKRPAIKLRFSKHGDPKVEIWYATSFVDTGRVQILKAATSASKASPEAVEIQTEKEDNGCGI